MARAVRRLVVGYGRGPARRVRGDHRVPPGAGASPVERVWGATIRRPARSVDERLSISGQRRRERVIAAIWPARCSSSRGPGRSWIRRYPALPMVLVDLGVLRREDRDLEGASELFRLASEAAAVTGDRAAGSIAKAELAYLRLDLEPHRSLEAGPEMEEVAATLRELGDEVGLVRVLIKLANTEFFRGRVARAEEVLATASDVVERFWSGGDARADRIGTWRHSRTSGPPRAPRASVASIPR